MRVGLSLIFLAAVSVSATAQIAGSGTANKIPVFTGSSSVGDSPISASGGNVGIATTAPVTPLQVNGTITGGAGGSTSGQVILTGNYNGANDVLATWGTEYSSGAPLFGYGILPSTSLQGSFLSSSPLSSLPRAALTVGSNTGRITFFTGQSQSVAFGNPVNMNEVMVILNNGSVGIGTTNPNSARKLEIASGFGPANQSGRHLYHGGYIV